MKSLDRNGLTLVELLVAMLILVFFMGTLASFYIGISKSAATARRAAWAGQSVERALTMLHQELAGATYVKRLELNQLSYGRIRVDEGNGQDWIILIKDNRLIRRSQTTNFEVELAKDISSFEFILPHEKLDENGQMIDPNMIWVIVGAGNFTLDDSIYLRNR